MTRRGKAIAWGAAAVVASLMLFMPLRFALALFAPPQLTAAQAQGSIWSGRLDHAVIGGMDLGTLDVGLKPLALLTGKLSFGFTRAPGNAVEPLTGSLTSGITGRGVSNVTGTVGSIASTIAPSIRIVTQDFSVRFAGQDCASASGQVRAIFATEFAGLSLRNGMSGEARCDGVALMLPMQGDSGLEKLTLRLWADGRYTARLTVTATDPTLSNALIAAGFAPSADGFIKTTQGRY